MPGQALPVPPTNHKVLQGVVDDAYRLCRALESWQDVSGTLTSGFPLSPEVGGRLLGYLLLFLPPQADERLAREIIACGSNASTMDLANFYFEQFVLAFRRHAPTPNPSEHPSRPSFDDSVDWFQLLIEEGPRNHQAAKVLALKRDNFRCLLTGCIDSSAILEGHLEWDHQTPLGRTEVCHIIPKGIFSNISGDNEGGPRHRAAAGVAAVLAQFSSPNVPADLSGPGMNALGNLLTLRADLHQEFDRLDFWFEETNAPNTYTIGRIHPGIVSQMTQPITFTTADPSYDLPNADYLRLHAICARIAHLSGAGELIDRVYRDSELVSPLRIVDGELEMMYLKAQLQSIVVRTLVQEVQ